MQREDRRKEKPSNRREKKRRYTVMGERKFKSYKIKTKTQDLMVNLIYRNKT